MSDIENIKGRMRAAFATTPLTDDKWQAVLDILHANGYRRCAEGQRTTQWCGEVEKLRHDIERHIDSLAKTEAEVERLKERDAEWERKASAWMASPEAAQRLDGYQELAQRLNVAEAERDALRSALEALVNRCNADFLMATDEANIAAEAALERAYLAARGES